MSGSRRARGVRPTVFVVGGGNGHVDLRAAFGLLNCEIREFASAEAFLTEYRPGGAACLVLALDGSDRDALDALRRVRRRHVGLPVIILAERGSVPLAVRTMRAGATAFVETPCARGLLAREIRRALS